MVELLGGYGASRADGDGRLEIGDEGLTSERMLSGVMGLCTTVDVAAGVSLGILAVIAVASDMRRTIRGRIRLPSDRV